jgi:hypothetical protein
MRGDPSDDALAYIDDEYLATCDVHEGVPPVTLNEAAVVLGLSPETLRVQINRGKLRAKKVGPVWTVTPHEIERYRRESLGRRLAGRTEDAPK